MKNALAVLGHEATDEEHDAWRYHVEINKELRRVEMWVIFPDDLTVERHGLHIGYIYACDTSDRISRLSLSM
jgi:hypothetical protein